MEKVKKKTKQIFWIFLGLAALVIMVLAFEVIRTYGRTQVQVNIHQNKELIYRSTFGEPPQFAVWLESPETGRSVTVFVTHRAGIGDWEGKSDVPVALPRWHELFKGEGGQNTARAEEATDDYPQAVSGATPKDDYFSVRAEVKPGTRWICWVEMNLAGDYNEAYPEQDLESMEVDEFACGQPALIYRSEIVADEGSKYDLSLVNQSVWKDGITTLEPVSEGMTTAKDVFDKMDIEIIRPKPKLINWHKIFTSKDKASQSTN